MKVGPRSSCHYCAINPGGDQDAGRSLFVVAALPSRPRVGPSLITEAVLDHATDLPSWSSSGRRV